MLYLTGKPFLLPWHIRHAGSWRDNLSFLSFYSPTHIGWYSSGRVVEYGRVGCVDELILTFKQHKIIEQYQFFWISLKNVELLRCLLPALLKVYFILDLKAFLLKITRGTRDQGTAADSAAVWLFSNLT